MVAEHLPFHSFGSGRQVSPGSRTLTPFKKCKIDTSFGFPFGAGPRLQHTSFVSFISGLDFGEVIEPLGRSAQSPRWARKIVPWLLLL